MANTGFDVVIKNTDLPTHFFTDGRTLPRYSGVLSIPWDDMEIVELALDLEEELDFDIPDAEVVSWVGTTLSVVVDRLLTLEKTRTPQSSRRHLRWKRHKA